MPEGFGMSYEKVPAVLSHIVNFLTSSCLVRVSK
jgi:hypothetical protein